MEIVKVNSIERAAYLTYLEVRNKSKINIALTGGNFCNAFINQVIENQLDINSWNIFFTDERITSESEEINSLILCDKLKEAINFNPSNVFPFNHQSLDDSYGKFKGMLCENWCNFIATLRILWPTFTPSSLRINIKMHIIDAF